MPQHARPGLIAVFAVAACALTAGPAAADPGYKAAPGALTFDFVEVGTTSEPQTLVISNDGTDANTLGQIEVGGTAKTEFSIVEDGCSNRALPSGIGCTVRVVFRPAVRGTRVANLRIPDSTSCPNWVTLAGSATQTSSPPPGARAAVCQGPKQTVAIDRVLQPGEAPPQVITTNTVIDGPKRTCVSRRRFRIRLRPPSGTSIESARVTVAGKKVPTQRIKRRTTALVDLRGRQSGPATVRITIDASDGNVYKGKRTYRTCARKAPGGTPRY